MRKYLIMVFMLIGYLAKAQNTTTLPSNTNPITPQNRILGTDSLHQWWVNFPGIGYNRVYTATEVNEMNRLAGSVSSSPTNGDAPRNIYEFIQLFYKSQPPLATLTGGSVNELTSATTATFTLNWSATRQAATKDLSTVNITGNSQTYPQSFTNPSAGGTVNGTQSITAPTNVSTTYTLTVTTIDGKTATATTTRSYSPRRYWGRSTTTIPTSSAILAAAGGSSELNNTKAKSGFVISASGSNRVFYAYPSSLGNLTSITIGGFETIDAFTLNTVSVTNSSGYVQDYNVYVSNNTFSATTPNIITQ